MLILIRDVIIFLKVAATRIGIIRIVKILTLVIWGCAVELIQIFFQLTVIIGSSDHFECGTRAKVLPARKRIQSKSTTILFFTADLLLFECCVRACVVSGVEKATCDRRCRTIVPVCRNAPATFRQMVRSVSFTGISSGHLTEQILVEMPCKGTEHCDILIRVLERTMTRLAGFRQRQEMKCPHRLNEKELPCRIATVSQV